MKRTAHIFLIFAAFLAALASCQPVTVDTNPFNAYLAVGNEDGSIENKTSVISCDKNDNTIAKMSLWIYTTHDIKILSIHNSKIASDDEFVFKATDLNTVLTPQYGKDNNRHVVITSEPRKIKKSGPEILTVEIEDQVSKQVQTLTLNYWIQMNFQVYVSRITVYGEGIPDEGYTFTATDKGSSASKNPLSKTYITDGDDVDIYISSSLPELILDDFEISRTDRYSFHEEGILVKNKTYTFEKVPDDEMFSLKLSFKDVTVLKNIRVDDASLMLKFSMPNNSIPNSSISEELVYDNNNALGKPFTLNSKFRFSIEPLSDNMLYEGRMPIMYARSDNSSLDNVMPTVIKYRATSSRPMVYCVDASTMDVNRKGLSYADFILRERDEANAQPRSKENFTLKEINNSNIADFSHKLNNSDNNRPSWAWVREPMDFNCHWLIYDRQDPNFVENPQESGNEHLQVRKVEIWSPFHVVPENAYEPDEKITVTWNRPTTYSAEYTKDGLPTFMDVRFDGVTPDTCTYDEIELSFTYDSIGMDISFNDATHPDFNSSEMENNIEFCSDAKSNTAGVYSNKWLKVNDQEAKDYLSYVPNSLRENKGKIKFRIPKKSSKSKEDQEVGKFITVRFQSKQGSDCKIVPITVRRPIDIIVDMKVNGYSCWGCTGGGSDVLKYTNDAWHNVVYGLSYQIVRSEGLTRISKLTFTDIPDGGFTDIPVGDIHWSVKSSLNQEPKSGEGTVRAFRSARNNRAISYNQTSENNVDRWFDGADYAKKIELPKTSKTTVDIRGNRYSIEVKSPWNKEYTRERVQCSVIEQEAYMGGSGRFTCTNPDIYEASPLYPITEYHIDKNCWNYNRNWGACDANYEDLFYSKKNFVIEEVKLKDGDAKYYKLHDVIHVYTGYDENNVPAWIRRGIMSEPAKVTMRESSIGTYVKQ